MHLPAVVNYSPIRHSLSLTLMLKFVSVDPIDER